MEVGDASVKSPTSWAGLQLSPVVTHAVMGFLVMQLLLFLVTHAPEVTTTNPGVHQSRLGWSHFLGLLPVPSLSVVNK